MTRRDKWKKRPSVLRYFAFKDACRLHKLTVTPESKIVFHIPMPKSWGKKKRLEMLGKPHLDKPDLDNCLKAIFDALLENDAHIWKINAEKRWAETGSIEID